MIYYAAVRLRGSAAAPHDLTEMTIHAGNYLSLTLNDWKNRTHRIGGIFQRLLQDERVDPEGYGVEWYRTDDELVCMIKQTSD